MGFAHPNDAWMGLCINWLSRFMCDVPTDVVIAIQWQVLLSSCLCCCNGSLSSYSVVIMVNVITYIVVIMGRYGDTH